MRAGKPSRDVKADISLAGTFVTLMREQNQLCYWLAITRKLQHRVMPKDLKNVDCSVCAALSYAAVVCPAVGLFASIIEARTILDSATMMALLHTPLGFLWALCAINGSV
jgi:hypothetical protein